MILIVSISIHPLLLNTIEQILFSFQFRFSLARFVRMLFDIFVVYSFYRTFS
jgi:hypothetical protein